MIKVLVTYEELNPKKHSLTPQEECNLAHLYMAVNVLRHECGLPFIITSGVRSKEEQTRINNKAPNSAHRIAAACDIADADGKIWDWLSKNLDLVEEVGAYLESKAYTPKHVHIQVVPPKSGSRIFIP